MSDEEVGYARREFLGQCLAAPALGLGLSGLAHTANKPTEDAAVELRYARLLAQVPKELFYRRTPLPDDKNAWRFWLEAHGKLVSPFEGEFAEDLKSEEQSIIGFDDPAPRGSQWAAVDRWLQANREPKELIETGLGQPLQVVLCVPGRECPLHEMDVMRHFEWVYALGLRHHLGKGRG